MFDPDGADGNLEWIELYNVSDDEQDLSGWDLDPDSGSYINLDNKKIEGKSYLLVEGVSKMRNDKGQVSLYESQIHNKDTMVDYVQYGAVDLGSAENKIRDRAVNEVGIWKSGDFVINIKEGSSIGLEENITDLNLSKNWKIFEKNGTPGTKNVELEEPMPIEPKIYPRGIMFNELFPEPFKNSSDYEEGFSEEYKKEYIEIFNSSDKEVSLDGWKIVDYGKHECKLDGKKIGAGKLLAIKDVPDGDCDLELNDTGNEIVSLKNPNAEIVFEVNYSSAKEGKSYNFDGSRWRWSKFLTPGTENILNNEPYGTVKIDEDIFKDAYADFFVSTGDGDGETVKVTWDFGDGHKSYQVKTRHKYEETGKYQASVKLSDGSEDVIKNFEIEVKKFPHPKVRIVAISANPNGADSGEEFLTVENKSNKKINLNGWSIATGWKKFINHPIREDVFIKRNKSKDLTNDVSSFTLNNTKAKIQLRYPDGAVAHEVKYKSTEKTIAEGSVYQRVKGGWAWKISEQEAVNSEQQKYKEQVEMSSNQEIEVGTEKQEDVVQSDVKGVAIEKKENTFVMLENDVVIGKIQISDDELRALEINSVREFDGQYILTVQGKDSEHYAITFFKNISSGMNAKINSLLNFF